MIGFITTQEEAEAVNSAIAEAQTSRGFAVSWLAGSFPIYHGEHEGKSFIPCNEIIMSTPLMGNPPQTPRDFPEFAKIINSLGGLDARIDLDPESISLPLEAEPTLELDPNP
jgi:hypothetical protein